MCGYLLHAPYWGPGLLPVPWLGVELMTLCFTGWHSVHWATPARAKGLFFKCIKVKMERKPNKVWIKFELHENIVVSKRSQTRKATYCMIPFKWNIQHRPTYALRRQVSGCGAWDEGDGKWALVDQGLSWGWWNVLEWDRGNGRPTLWIYESPLSCAPQNGGFVLYELYLNKVVTKKWIRAVIGLYKWLFFSVPQVFCNYFF